MNPSMGIDQPPSVPKTNKALIRPLEAVVMLLLLVLIAIGIAYRLSWVNWSQGANLHPDEYGLTNTLTQLSLPEDMAGYFNTRLSPLSPYPKYDELGQIIANGPDNRMRWGQWPQILIRAAAEWSGATGYNELRLLGRTLSALVDCLTLLLLFLFAKKLYGWKIGLLASALSALAVLQIQQSHFMTVDTFAVLFTMLAMYACARIARTPGARRPPLPSRSYRINPSLLGWYLLFGIAFGMALATRINLLPLGGMILIAAFLSIADLKLGARQDFYRILVFSILLLVLSGAVTLLTFRITQPMSFRASSGDTSFFTFQLNPDWTESMRIASSESRGIGGGPPSEQWAHRPAIIFPLVNMVLWGMGLPLGLAAWVGYLWALWRTVRWRDDWRAHLLPLVWTGGYFVFMATRWVKSIRYFLPIYPFLCLFAAWALIECWRWAVRRDEAGTGGNKTGSRRWLRKLLAVGLSAMILLGTLSWANAFASAIYRQDLTRIQATRWIFENVPAPFHLQLTGNDGDFSQPIPARDGLVVMGDHAYVQSFTMQEDGTLSSLLVPHATAISDGEETQLRVEIAQDPEGNQPVDEANLTIQSPPDDSPGMQAEAPFQGAALQAGQTYYLIASTLDDRPVMINRSVIANEHWDEGLPFPFDGWDPFGQLYRGVDMEVRRYDDVPKREMLLDRIAQADFIILPSQRALWSHCRIPLTYPMTMEYYRALFDGRLGFDLVGEFQSLFRLGGLAISDLGGSAAWKQDPDLPLFNHNLLAAEEAFSVYDHPPVWIFKKNADFDLQNAAHILESVDLSQVVVQSPFDSTGEICP